jgi:hypothetical protein
MAENVESKRPSWEELFKNRKVPRRAIRKRIGVLAAGKYAICMAYDIGEGGLSLGTDLPLKDGQVVVITFRIPNVISGVMTGKIVYSMPAKNNQSPRYGVQFTNISFEVKRLIRNFVASATSYAADDEAA